MSDDPRPRINAPAMAAQINSQMAGVGPSEAVMDLLCAAVKIYIDNANHGEGKARCSETMAAAMDASINAVFDWHGEAKRGMN